MKLIGVVEGGDTMCGSRGEREGPRGKDAQFLLRTAGMDGGRRNAGFIKDLTKRVRQSVTSEGKAKLEKEKKLREFLVSTT